jgi:uncharacterized membrane protein
MSDECCVIGKNSDVASLPVAIINEPRQMNILAFTTLLCALGSGLVAGLFFAFSTCVMKALGQQPPSQGIAAMQAINVVILNGWFLTVFLGTALICAGLMVTLLLDGQSSDPAYLLVGCVLYITGTFGITMLFNVPRNNLLAKASASSEEAEHLWGSYLIEWTRWNHVRMLAALGASTSFIIALRTH